MIGPSFLVPMPHVPEYDFSGVVLDENKSEFVAGDSVYGIIPIGELHILFCLFFSLFIRVILWSYTTEYTTRLPGSVHTGSVELSGEKTIEHYSY